MRLVLARNCAERTTVGNLLLKNSNAGSLLLEGVGMKRGRLDAGACRRPHFASEQHAQQHII
jgi:hypothetical protein